MTGKDLKKILTSKGYTTSLIAEALGKKSQDINQIFTKTEDVKTGLLEKLCKALEVDMTFFYEGTEYLPEYSPTEIQQQNVPLSLYKEVLFERDKYMIELIKTQQK